MLRTPARLRLALSAAALTAAAAGCSSTADPSAIAGSYQATTLRVVPTGQSAIDVLAAGGTLSVTISSTNTTTGTLYVPASLNAGTAYTDNIAGTAVRTGNTVQFTESNGDSFLQGLTFTVNGSSLSANQTLGTATYVVVLTR